MRNNVVTARDINNTNTRLKAFRYDPRLHIIRPTPVSPARLDNFAATNKSIICHANLQIVLETFSHRQQASKYSQSNGAETVMTALGRIHPELYARCREAMGREASPTAAIIDSQSVKSAEKGRCIDQGGYDAGEKVGLLLHALVHPTDVQDRDGGVLVLKTLFGRYLFMKKLFADGGYQGPVFEKGQKKPCPHWLPAS